MHNPFTELANDDQTDAVLVEQSKNGNRAALEKLVLRHQAWIYNIAVRMVFQPQDAEEVTQEVLINVITKLSTFRGESKFRTWLYRIAANHVLNMRRRTAETRVATFAAYGAAIDKTPNLDLPDPKSVPVALPMLVEEVKNSCTMGMLLCLDRQQRLIFTLGAILGVSDAIGGEVLEMSADSFRQCLKDEGHTYQGRAAIKKWKADTSTKYQYTCEPFACEEKDGKTVVTSRLTGNFPGSPVDLRFFFELEGEKIASLEIIP